MVKPIPDRPGYYCDPSGRIFSDKSGQMRQMKTQIKRTGYESIALSSGRKGRYWHDLVHLLVLKSWVGPPPKGFTCNHKNGRRADNRLVNLEWVSRQENERHARRELGKKLYGEFHPLSKVTTDEIHEIRKLRSEGWPYRAIGERYGLGISQVSRICKMEAWSHLA